MRSLNPGYKLLTLILASLLLSVTFHTRLNLLTAGGGALGALCSHNRRGWRCWSPSVRPVSAGGTCCWP